MVLAGAALPKQLPSDDSGVVVEAEAAPPQSNGATGGVMVKAGAVRAGAAQPKPNGAVDGASYGGRRRSGAKAKWSCR